MSASLTYDVLDIDCEAVASAISEWLAHTVLRDLKRRGVVLGVSGGIDSSVVAALCVQAFGAERVLGLFTPERDSDDDTLRYSRLLADSLKIESQLEDITPLLEAAGCYHRRDEAFRTVIPEFGVGWRAKIVLPDVVQSQQLPVFSVIAQSPQDETIRRRLSTSAYLGVVAATNFKQRTRKMIEYYHADRRNYAVAGTPNRLEYDQGFFVKGGDGLADVKPIAHLYKSQVYALAEYLALPDAIRRRPPTTDTYSLPQAQDEFYFALPYRKLDLCLYAKNNGHPAESVCEAVQLSPAQVERVFQDIDRKRRATRGLHLPPLLVEEVAEVDRTASPTETEPAGAA